MSFDLSNEEKLSLLQQRLKAFYAEKFQHELNKTTAEAVGNAEAAKVADENIALIEAAIETHNEVLSTLSE